MGDRVSIQFERDDRRSVVLFDHWGGTDTVHMARRFAEKVARAAADRLMKPMDRLEPEHVIVAFVLEYATPGDSCYLGVDEHDGDNSDNGHHVIPLLRVDEPGFGIWPEAVRS